MRRTAVLLLVAASVRSAAAHAQQLEPRAYSPAPVGLNFAVLSYLFSSGGVVTDPSLPVSDVDAKINGAALLYNRTFGLVGRSASAALLVPYAWGKVSGNVGEERREITRSGLGDLGVRLAANLLGGPALSPQEFATHRPRTTLGASLWIGAPSGQYDPTRLINLGSNRWAFKPEIGLSHPAGHWVFEVYAGSWFFTPNNDFFGGVRRTQEPIATFSGYVSYSVRPRLWISANGTFYTGGRTTVDGVRKDDTQSNTRVGLTCSLPIGRSQSVKLAWATGATTRLGQDFDTYAIAWQYMWWGRR